jgi:hypothetical protein
VRVAFIGGNYTGSENSECNPNTAAACQKVKNDLTSGLVAITSIQPSDSDPSNQPYNHLGGNVSINAQPQGGDAYGVITVGNRIIAPTANPTNSFLLYSDTGAMKYRDAAGNTTTGTGNLVFHNSPIFTKVCYSATVCDHAGTGTPEGAITAGIGSTYRDTTNGDFYRKTAGAGNTGWVTP